MKQTKYAVEIQDGTFGKVQLLGVTLTLISCMISALILFQQFQILIFALTIIPLLFIYFIKPAQKKDHTPRYIVIDEPCNQMKIIYFNGKEASIKVSEIENIEIKQKLIFGKPECKILFNLKSNLGFSITSNNLAEMRDVYKKLSEKIYISFEDKEMEKFFNQEKPIYKAAGIAILVLIFIWIFGITIGRMMQPPV